MIVGLRSDNTVVVIANSESEFRKKLKILFGINRISTEYMSVDLKDREINNSEIDTLLKTKIVLQ